MRCAAGCEMQGCGALRTAQCTCSFVLAWVVSVWVVGRSWFWWDCCCARHAYTRVGIRVAVALSKWIGMVIWCHY
ncbi:uncharacterized protein P174DRAFT_216681 [Aspergillus novofumigatus IBT 16806]|uniref:Uncharacterized protein n=1 Tax=Aspergillus novofumigatus (strain IBT 16806) TaxID=1392255 RepID=A0A2I1C5N2_ASPN1|nr:uncharacterized protein P174DRAFT_216681 [Aspergillus novofumigatus IBT 16806]PKX92933.1 hypothetical protein P174DRAFT_216681 [Aspergillus novofumigatus IBT 16806]